MKSTFKGILSGSQTNRKLNWMAPLALLLAAPAAHAEGWCELLPGWSVVTHGTRADNVFILGQFQGAPNGIWIQISSATIGKANVAVALGAQLAGKGLSLYVDSASYTCATFPSWAPLAEIRHVMVKN
jgi:hypothetical protein